MNSLPVAPAAGALAALERLRRLQVDEVQLGIDQIPNLAAGGTDQPISALVLGRGRLISA